MANGSNRKIPPASRGVTASGIVEAVEQDFELSMEQIRAVAQEAVAAVGKKLGVSKPPARTRKPAKKLSAKPAKTIASKAAKRAKTSRGKNPK